MFILTETVEDQGIEARADGVPRVAAGHAKGDGAVARDLTQEIDAVVVRLARRLEVALLEQGARMGQGVDIEVDPLLDPALELGCLRVDAAGHDADRSAAVDVLE